MSTPSLPDHPPRPTPSVARQRAEPALGHARHRVDRLALRRLAAGLDDAAGRRRGVAVAGLGRRLRRRCRSAAGARESDEALVDDPDVDVVYVATPHHAHLACASLALGAGKHVLVEKPLGLNASEAQSISAAAAAAGVFCMEAMWSLFLPSFDVMRQVLDAGLLGDVRTVIADHGEHFDPPHRILDPAMAGGSLLDLGTYVTTLATWALGPATRVQASGRRRRPASTARPRWS